jgi:hypothetical protein
MGERHVQPAALRRGWIVAPVHSALTLGRWAVASLLALFLTFDSVAAQTLTLTRAEALATARQAYLSGDPALTYAIASKIAASDPFDVEALLLLSASHQALGRADDAFVFGRRAWAAAREAGRPAGLRHEIAQQTAHAAWDAGRYRSAVHWLGRAMKLAPDEAAEERDAANQARVGAQIRLRFSGKLQINPTDNLNAGARTGLLIVQDQVVGGLSGWSVAHAGVQTFGQLGAEYDLGVSPSGRARNSIGFGLSATLHSLIASEALANPDLDASDLDMWTARLNWMQERFLGGEAFAGLGPLQFTLDATQNWYAGKPYSPSLRAELRVPLSRSNPALSLTTALERQWQDSPSGTVDGASLHLQGQKAVALPWATGQLTYTLGGAIVRGGWSNAIYDSLDASLMLDPGVALGPVRPQIGLGTSWRDYETYSLGFANVTKGRTDTSVWLRAGLQLEGIDLAGMTPTLSVMRDMTWSNISKYETATTALYLGLAAEF